MDAKNDFSTHFQSGTGNSNAKCYHFVVKILGPMARVDINYGLDFQIIISRTLCETWICNFTAGKKDFSFDFVIFGTRG